MPLWSVPKLLSPRGAGLGNEVFSWAKAYLGARALGLREVPPPWAINPRRYDRELGGGLGRSAKYVIIRSLPAYEITWEDVLATGAVDYFEAVQKLRPTVLSSRAPVVLHGSGMHGGYLGIRRARAYLRHAILGPAAAVRSHELIDEIEPTRVRIGVHYRGGTDFREQDAVKPGVFNSRLPIEWYESVVQSLVKQLAVPVEVLLASDSEATQLAEALSINGRYPTRVANTSVGDLAALARCDLIVPSVSSFSMLAIFLSNAAYVWHADNLYVHSGWASIWGHGCQGIGGEPKLRAAEFQAASHLSARRGIPQGTHPVWSEAALRRLRDVAALRNLSSDLIYSGVVPADVNI